MVLLRIRESVQLMVRPGIVTIVFRFYFIILCIWVLPACKFMYHVHTVPKEARGVRFSGTRVIDGYELLCGN